MSEEALHLLAKSLMKGRLTVQDKTTSVEETSVHTSNSQENDNESQGLGQFSFRIGGGN
jgi:hypothetical protein